MVLVQFQVVGPYHFYFRSESCGKKGSYDEFAIYYQIVRLKICSWACCDVLRWSEFRHGKYKMTSEKSKVSFDR